MRERERELHPIASLSVTCSELCLSLDSAPLSLWGYFLVVFHSTATRDPQERGLSLHYLYYCGDDPLHSPLHYANAGARGLLVCGNCMIRTGNERSKKSQYTN